MSNYHYFDTSGGFPTEPRYIQNADGTFTLVSSPHFNNSLDSIADQMGAMQSSNGPVPVGSALDHSIRNIVRDVMREFFLEGDRSQSSEQGVDGETKQYYGGIWREEVHVNKHLSLDGCRIRNIALPINDSDAVNKAYVEEFVTNAIGVMREQLKKEMLGDGLEALKLRVKNFSLLGDNENEDRNHGT